MRKCFLFLSLALGLVACNTQGKTTLPETSEVETTATVAVNNAEFSNNEVAGPLKDATYDVLEARRAARNDYGLAH